MKPIDPLTASPELEHIGTTDSELALLHIYPSHEYTVAIDQLQQRPAPVLILPHTCMAPGDTVKLTWKSYRNDTLTYTKDFYTAIKETDKLIEFSLADSEFSIAKGHYVMASFAVLAEGSTSPKFTSTEQRFNIVETFESDTHLPPPSISGAEDGYLDPELIDDKGATVTLRYDDIEKDDEGVLVIQAFNINDNAPCEHIRQWRRADSNDVENKRLHFTFDKAWFEQQFGNQLELRAQAAGASFARSSTASQLTVKKKRNLPAPTLAGAVNNEVTARVIRQCAVLQLPKEAEIQGATVLGCVGTEQGILLARVAMKPPSEGQDNVIIFAEALFSSYIGESLIWYYEVCDGIAYEHSEVRKIKLNNVPVSAMPAIQCVETYGEGTLALKNLTPDLSGATLILNRWPFMKQGQIVNISVSLKYNNKDRGNYALAKHIVSANDVTQSAVVTILPSTELLQVQKGSHMVITAQVAFRDGGPAQPFKSVTLQLID